MKSKNLIFVAIAFVAMATVACSNNSIDTVKIETKADTVAYSVGHTVGGNLYKQFGDVNPEVLAKGIIDAFAEKENELFESPEKADVVIRAYMREAQDAKNQAIKEKSDAFLAENAKKEGITVTESGLQYEVLVEGDGEKPTAESTVTVHYHGTTIDGEVFDSSVEKGQPATFPLNGVIKGWTEGVQLMSVGSKYKFYIPSELAYGTRGAGPKIGPNAALIFEVELLSIEK